VVETSQTCTHFPPGSGLETVVEENGCSSESAALLGGGSAVGCIQLKDFPSSDAPAKNTEIEGWVRRYPDRFLE
jgi:hypothetical protein